MKVIGRLTGLLCLCLLTAGCPGSPAARQFNLYSETPQPRQRTRADVVAGYRSRALQYEAYAAPKNYKQQVDQHLAGVLKDPDSRKVQFAKNSGAIVCGSVNAKNSYGGYTGAQPFGALFDQGGSMTAFRLFGEPHYGTYYEYDDGGGIMAIGCGLPLAN